jgi:2,4-dichlorophenol 6-monooxygenase
MAEFNDGIADTAVVKDGVIETEVLIVGSGPAGASAALFLSTLGVGTMLITKYRWTANSPRAHLANQRTMETFRDVGIEAQVLAEASPHELLGNTVFCTSLAGDEVGRIRSWGTDPRREADHRLASPSMNCDIPQHYLEPILVRNATIRGTQTRFSTEYLSHRQDADGVSVEVLDKLTGLTQTIRAKYLIGADGARSKVAADLDLPFVGKMDVAGSMNITFKAELGDLVHHRPSVLYIVVNPDSQVGGVGGGIVRMVRPWNEWLIVWGYDITKPPPSVDDAQAAAIVRNLIGVPDLDVEITGATLWGNNEQYATLLHRGRVFCAGDAVHRHPPNNGLGSNTSIQDAYNLAWKLAAVLRGSAGPGLLESYSAERAPIAEQLVKRTSKSGGEYGGIYGALGLAPGKSPEELAAGLADLAAATPAARANREALRQAMELKHYEFNTHGVELGQFYDSAAVAGDGSPRPVSERDPELYYQPSTVPGARLPHAWVGGARRTLSTLDLAPYGQFTLITGIGGQAWIDAAGKVGVLLGVTIGGVVIGPGQDVGDLYFDWAGLREVDEDGALLVRPDKHIGWRSQAIPADPEQALLAAMTAILDREQARTDQGLVSPGISRNEV